MEPSLATVLTPTRNRRGFLPRLVEQFLAQDYAPKELILINGGDPIEDLIPPGYGEMIRIVEARTPAPNAAARIAAALNAGIRAARGEHCFRFDDDDWQHSGRIAKQLALFRLTGKSVVAGSSGLFVSEAGDEAFEYTGDPWSCSGFSHAFRRSYGLAHPYPEEVSEETGEDLAFIREAHRLGELCAVSGADWLAARDHGAGTSGGRFSDPARRDLLLSSDNWRRVPFARVRPILRPS